MPRGSGVGEPGTHEKWSCPDSASSSLLGYSSAWARPPGQKLLALNLSCADSFRPSLSPKWALTQISVDLKPSALRRSHRTVRILHSDYLGKKEKEEENWSTQPSIPSKICSFSVRRSLERSHQTRSISASKTGSCDGRDFIQNLNCCSCLQPVNKHKNREQNH